MIKALTKHWKLLFLFFCGSLLVIAAVLRALTPPGPEVPQTPFVTTNYKNERTTFSRVIYTGPTFETPKKLPIIQVQTTSLEDTTIAEITQKYNLTKVSTDGSLRSNDQNQFLKKEWKGTKYQLFFGENPTAVELQQRRSLEELQAIANSLVRELFPDTQLQLIESEIRGFKSDEELPEAVENEVADMYVMPFSHTVAGFPTFFDKNIFFPLEVVVDMSGRVQQLDFYPTSFSQQTLGDKPTISPSQAVENINQGIGSIISARLAEVAPLNISQISSAELTQVQLEYRTDPASNLLYPFYRFSGTGTNPQGTQMELEIITPAVQTTSN